METYILKAIDCSRGGKAISSVRLVTLQEFFEKWERGEQWQDWYRPKVIYILKPDNSPPIRVTAPLIEKDFPELKTSEFYKAMKEIK